MQLKVLCVIGVLAFGSPAMAQEAELFDCVATPAGTMKLGSPVTGLLGQVNVRRGDQVKAGDEVARLESSVEEASVRLAEIDADAGEAIGAQRKRLEVAQAALERSRELVESGSVTRTRLDELQAAVDITQLDLEAEQRKAQVATLELARQRALLERLTIRSPIDGTVVSVDTQVGEFVRQDSVVATIVQTDPLYVDAYLPTALWAETRVGAEVDVLLERPTEAKLRGSVIVVDSVFDTASDTFGIRVELPNPGNTIPGGQRCRLDLLKATPAG